MKKITYILAALSLTMFGACNREGELTAPANGDSSYAGGDGYMTVQLGFVGANGGSRVDYTQNFEDGTAEESTIRNIYTYYFNENNVYLGHEMGVITDQSAEQTPGNNIERSADVTVPADVISYLVEGGSAKVIVVLNQPTNFAPTLTANVSTYADFNNSYVPNTDNAEFMMSSVNYLTNETAPEEHNMTTISSANVWKKGSSTSLAGTAIQPVTIYVERICGKVKLDSDSFTQPSDATASVEKWGLNVRNKKVYPVKKLQVAGAYPQWGSSVAYFELPGTKLGGSNYSWNDASNVRSYWAVDPNYNDSDNHVSGDVVDFANHFTLTSISDLDGASDDVRYCLENTFEAAHQNRDETTTAVVLAKYVPNSIQGTDMTSQSEKTWVIYKNLYWTKNSFINEFLKDQKIFTDSEGKVQATYNDVDFNITTQVLNGSTIVGGTYALATPDNETLYQTNADVTSEITDWNPINTVLGTSAQIYYEGYCYYEIPIRHFTDQEVPLDEDHINDLDQLGRYGIVRNHYYQLTINSIKNPGKPIEDDEITPDDDPDDLIEYYMDVTINVLSWAVRTQGVDL